MTLAIVPSPPKSPRCACAKCRHRGAEIHRAWMAEHANVDETELAKWWHAYYPAFERLLDRLPHRAAHATFAAKETAALRHLREWNDREDCDLTMAVLAGPTGTGKTVAAIWVALHRRANDSPAFVTAPELQRHFRDRELHEQLLGESMLIVDDLGTEQLDERFAADFDELVDTYYQGNSTLVVTTNCTSAQFAERYGARVVDRLAEVGAWISVAGKSLRRRSR